MKLSKIVEALDATFLYGAALSDIDIDKVGASDLMSDILAACSDGGILLTGLATVQAVKTAVIAGIGAVILVRNKQPARDAIAMARQHDMPLLSTPFSLFVSSGRLYRLGLTGLNGSR